MPSLPFNTEQDLRGVTLIGALPQVLAVNPPRRRTPAGMDRARQEGPEVPAVRDRRHRLARPLRGRAAAVARKALAAVHVPYRGAGPAMADVIGGQVPAVLGTLSGILPHVKGGKLKAIA